MEEIHPSRRKDSPSNRTRQVSIQRENTGERTAHHPRRQSELTTQHSEVRRRQLHHSV